MEKSLQNYKLGLDSFPFSFGVEHLPSTKTFATGNAMNDEKLPPICDSWFRNYWNVLEVKYSATRKEMARCLSTKDIFTSCFNSMVLKWISALPPIKMFNSVGKTIKPFCYLKLN